MLRDTDSNVLKPGARAPEDLAATGTGERIAALDVLRGFALFGVLLVNLPSFAMTSDVAYEPPAGVVDSLAWSILVAFGMLKFVALFSLLFGMGLVLQMQRAERAGRPFRGLYLRRLGILALIGLLHGTFLFLGDILLVYSLAGLVLFLCRDWPPARLLKAAALLFVLGVTLSSVTLTALESETAQPVRVPTWQPDENVRLGQLDKLENDAVWVAFELKAYKQGPYLSTLLVNSVFYAVWLVISTITSFNCRVLALFFVGAALMKLDFFSERRSRWHTRLAGLGLLGLVMELVHTWLAYRAGSMTSPSVAAIVINEIGATLLAAGYAGWIVTNVRRGTFPRLQRGLAAVGRTALTNYILQSLVCCLMFRWYGLGLYAELSYGWLAAITLALFAVQIALSSSWLRRYASGPLEAAWRVATYR